VCVKPDAYLSVDSIYYLTPHDVATLCLKSSANLLVAAHHVFDDAFGSFADGEATYELTSPSEVTMHVTGNSIAYHHSSLAWMRTGFCHVTLTGSIVSNAMSLEPTYTLCWERLQTFPSHVVTVFRCVPGLYSAFVPKFLHFSQVLQSRDYYGEIQRGSIVESTAKVTVVGELLQLPDVRIYSWGPCVLLYNTSSTIDYVAPKGLVDVGVHFMNGKHRTTDNFSALLAHLRHKVQCLKMPHSLLNNCIFATACIAFVQNVDMELALLHAIVKPHRFAIRDHSAALAMDYKLVWDKRLAAVVATITTIAAIAVGVVVPGVAPLVVAAMSVGAVGGGVAASLARRHKVTDPFLNYRHDRSSVAPCTRVMMLPPTTLPTTKPSVTPVQLASTPIDPSATVRLRDVTTERREVPMVVGGIVTTTNIPVVVENSAASSAVAMVTRATAPQPYHTSAYSAKLFKQFRDWVMHPPHFDQLLPTFRSQPIKKTPFAQWNTHERFPVGQVKVQERCYQQLYKQAGKLEPIMFQRGFFVKTECVTKSTIDGVPSFKPRGIESGSPFVNVTTGPWFNAASKRLAKIWSCQRARGLIYASGATQEELGSALDSFLEFMPEPGALKGDFSVLDSTFHEEFVALEADIAAVSGAPTQCVDVMRRNTETFAKDKFDNRFSVDGTRHSGDQYTSEGNSKSLGCSYTFALAVVIKKIEKRMTLPSPSQVYDAVPHLAFVLGDDLCLFACPEFLRANASAIADVLRGLGLNWNPEIFLGSDAIHHATFCSSRFYPYTRDGKRYHVLQPCVARVLSKFGYYCEVPASMDPDRLVRGDAIGRLRQCSGMPFLEPLCKRLIELTNHVTAKKIYMTRNMHRALKYNFSGTGNHIASSHTWAMYLSVYQLTPRHEAAYIALLSKVTSLPAIVDYEPVAHVLHVDGVQVDPERTLCFLPCSKCHVSPCECAPPTNFRTPSYATPPPSDGFKLTPDSPGTPPTPSYAPSFDFEERKGPTSPELPASEFLSLPDGPRLKQDNVDAIISDRTRGIILDGTLTRAALENTVKFPQLCLPEPIEPRDSARSIRSISDAVDACLFPKPPAHLVGDRQRAPPVFLPPPVGCRNHFVRHAPVRTILDMFSAMNVGAPDSHARL
jgi:hypothetical protein